MQNEKPLEAYLTAREPQDEMPSWIGGGVLTKGAAILAGGQTKIGKTFLAFEIAELVTTGEGCLFGDPRFPTKSRGRVLMVEGELGIYGFRKRLKDKYIAFDKDAPKNFWFVPKGTYEPFRIDLGGWKNLAAMVKSVGADVVIIDPASYFISEGKNTNVRDFFQNFTRVREEVGNPDLSFVVMHHFRKPPSRKDEEVDNLSAYNFRDGSNWAGDPDTLLMLHRTESARDNPMWYLDVRLIPRHDEQPKDFKCEMRRDFTIRKIETSGDTARAVMEKLRA